MAPEPKPRRAPRAKPAATDEAPAPPAVKPEDVADAAQAPAAGPALKKKDFIDRVVAASGGKKKDVRDIVEATLQVLGAALSKGEVLNLPPLGKAQVNRSREVGGGELLIVKLRRGGKAETAKQPLAEDED